MFNICDGTYMITMVLGGRNKVTARFLCVTWTVKVRVTAAMFWTDTRFY